MMNISVGPSTLWMLKEVNNGEWTIFDGIKEVKSRDFGAFEIVPGSVPRAYYPRDRRSLGFEPGPENEEKLSRLKDVLAEFNKIAVHTPPNGLNISSPHEEIRNESRKLFLQYIDFGLEVGAEVITFHHGTYGTIPELEPIIQSNVDFGRQALDRIGDKDLELGYEVLGGPTADREYELLSETLEGIDDERFGLNLDVGHINLVNGGDAIDWAKEFRGLIKEIHMHGTYYRSDRSPGFITHSPVSQETCVDFNALFSTLARGDFSGPVISEIHAPDLLSYLDFSLEAKNLIENSEGIDS